MATKSNKSGGVKRQGPRVMPALRSSARKVRTAAKKAQLTLGDIISAAFETAGGEAREVIRLVTSTEMERALGRRIVFVP